MKLTRARRAVLQEAANRRGRAPYQPPLGAMPAIRWLHEAGLILNLGAMGYIASPLGEAALREPFGSQDEAHIAVDEWRAQDLPARRFLHGWVALRCKGGGWAIRMGFRPPHPSIILPEGIDKGLLR